MLYDWLFDEVHKWPAIKNKIERLRDSKLNSKLRTWEYLWNLVCTTVLRYDEDNNTEAIDKEVAAFSEGKRIPGMPNPKKKGKKRSASKNPKKVGNSSGGGGAGDKGGTGDSKGKTGATNKSIEKNIKRILQKPAAERTQKEKKQLPCRNMVRTGTCPKGAQCEYGHGAKLIAYGKEQLEKHASGAAAPKAKATPKAKAESKGGGKGLKQLEAAAEKARAVAAKAQSEAAKAANAAKEASEAKDSKSAKEAAPKAAAGEGRTRQRGKPKAKGKVPASVAAILGYDLDRIADTEDEAEE